MLLLFVSLFVVWKIAKSFKDSLALNCMLRVRFCKNKKLGTTWSRIEPTFSCSLVQIFPPLCMRGTLQMQFSCFETLWNWMLVQLKWTSPPWSQADVMMVSTFPFREINQLFFLLFSLGCKFHVGMNTTNLNAFSLIFQGSRFLYFPQYRK